MYVSRAEHRCLANTQPHIPLCNSTFCVPQKWYCQRPSQVSQLCRYRDRLSAQNYLSKYGKCDHKGVIWAISPFYVSKLDFLYFIHSSSLANHCYWFIFFWEEIFVIRLEFSFQTVRLHWPIHQWNTWCTTHQDDRACVKHVFLLLPNVDDHAWLAWLPIFYACKNNFWCMKIGTIWCVL